MPSPLRALSDWLRGEPGGHGRLIAAIEEFGKLERGWNSYHGARIAESARRRAIEFIRLLESEPWMPLPTVSPSPEGGVVLQWLLKNIEADIVFLPEGGEYTVARRGADEVLQEGQIGRLDFVLKEVSRYVAPR